MSQKVDVTIVGAGAVGLAIASQVARPGREVYILEKNSSFGLDQSSRNSGVIHAGMSYPNGSLKEKLCIEGGRIIYEICQNYGIACIRCGKLFIAMEESELGELHRLYENGRNNGVALKMLTQKEIGQIEPNLVAAGAFHSPDTGVFDAYSFMRCLLAEAQEKGAQIACKTEVTGIEKIAEGYKVTVKDPTGYSSFTTGILINSAGLYCDRIAEIVGIDIVSAKYKAYWVKGEFYSVSGGKGRLINGLIYPLALSDFTDIHVCLDTDRRLRLGPHFYTVDKISYEVDDSNRSTFVSSRIMKALPFIDAADLEPESSGISLIRYGDGFKDFVIKHEIDLGLEGLIDLVGIESPGLTSSPAIGRYVAEMVDKIL